MRTRGRHVPDPSWSHVDAHGHEHRFAGSDLPTLEWVVTGAYWCEMCWDEHEEGEWRCRQCGDVVEPRYGWSGEETHYVPGLMEAVLTVDGREIPVTVEEARALLELNDEARRERAVAIARAFRERWGRGDWSARRRPGSS